jgi:hypothetical protein
VGENSFATFPPSNPSCPLPSTPKNLQQLQARKRMFMKKAFGPCNIKYYPIAFEKQNEWAC